ncbi:MAG: hypothetical protein N2746_09005 [Deltaproteobacteria bacterium]|nr:hypothetical protein [Deltaproteobacteria bacterium]
MRTTVADISLIYGRSSCYRLFNISFGLAFFIGSAIAGYMYDYSISVLMIALAAIELSSIPFFILNEENEIYSIKSKIIGVAAHNLLYKNP